MLDEIKNLINLIIIHNLGGNWNITEGNTQIRVGKKAQVK